MGLSGLEARSCLQSAYVNAHFVSWQRRCYLVTKLIFKTSDAFLGLQGGFSGLLLFSKSELDAKLQFSFSSGICHLVSLDFWVSLVCLI
jgi:hypothetical protein